MGDPAPSSQAIWVDDPTEDNVAIDTKQGECGDSRVALGTLNGCPGNEPK